jgi:phage tail sheath protein FI
MPDEEAPAIEPIGREIETKPGNDGATNKPQEKKTDSMPLIIGSSKETEKDVEPKQNVAAKKKSKQIEPVSDVMKVDQLFIKAATPGSWGNNLSIKVDRVGINSDVALRYNIKEEDLFNLTIFEGGVQKERIQNVSVVEGSRRVDRVLEDESRLIRVQEKGKLPEKPPQDTVEEKSLTGGEDSGPLDAVDYIGDENGKAGLYALEKAETFNILCIPPDKREGNTPREVYQAAMAYCSKRRAMLIVDPPAEWGTIKETAAAKAKDGFADLGLSGDAARNAAIYFPRVLQSDPLHSGQTDIFVPCGIVAGIISRTDRTRGVWKAPAGLDAGLNGIRGLQANLTDAENGMLNPLGINCLRSFPAAGQVVWGARTLRGADQLADEYKYIPVRRLALYIEESLYRGTQWVVFEPNDEPLWSQIRLNVGAFMQGLFRQGAFQGTTPKDAYFVKCDRETTTQDDRNKGIVNIVVGFAPLKPAEFVVLKLQQMAGQIQT